VGAVSTKNIERLLEACYWCTEHRDVLKKLSMCLIFNLNHFLGRIAQPFFSGWRCFQGL